MKESERFSATSKLNEEIGFLETLDDQDSQIVRRILIRSLFSVIESLLSVMMETALPNSPQIIIAGSNFTKNPKAFFEICALSDMSYGVNDKGEIQIEPLKIPLRNKALFAINALARYSSVTIAPKEVEGWSDFCAAIKIRDRITHPKDEKDIFVSDADKAVVDAALKWLVTCNHRACGGTKF